jgi:hypothetical protein
MDMRFSEASLLSYQAQIREVIEFVKRRLKGMTSDEAMRSAKTSLGDVSELFVRLEQSFTGIAIPIRLREASILELQPALLARHVSSAARYGNAMIRKMQSVMAQGMVQGRTSGQLVDDIINISGFQKNRAWAWRIVRTESAEAQNAAHEQTIINSQQIFPDLQRKILATFDLRTAWDSIGVHGQVRDIGKSFTDGSGRVYMRPPSRPNDREVLIPWRARWPNTEHSQPPTMAQLRQVRQLTPPQRLEGRRLAAAERRSQSQMRRVYTPPRRERAPRRSA